MIGFSIAILDPCVRCFNMLPSPTKPNPKRQKYETKYQSAWEKEFPWITKSTSHSTAHCKICRKTFSISHGGKNDAKKHSTTAGHIANERVQGNSTPVTSFFATQHDDGVLRAECLFANFICEHNISFNTADHFTKLCKKMFPDSKIAQKFQCSRTKTTQIVKRSLAPSLKEEVVERCRTQPFSLSCDESNDNNGEKTLAVLVRYFTSEEAVTRFLAIPVCNIGTGANIFQHLNQVFLDHNIPWTNCISFMSDNCSVMTGKHNSVMSRIKEVQPSVFDLGCICHLANLCTVAAVKSLPLPVEDLLVDVYYHFHHSAKRKEEYKAFMDFVEVEPLKILKHCSTRWLSLQRAVDRLLHHWPALKSYFTSHEDVEKPGWVKRTAELLANPEMCLYFHFLRFILPFLVDFNTMFQADETRLPLLGLEMNHLMRKMLGKFVKVKVIKEAEDISTVKFKDSDVHLNNECLAIGLTARSYLHEHIDDISPSMSARFFEAVKAFYITATDKMVKKFPFKDPVIHNLQFLIPDKRDDINPAVVTEMAQRFPSIIPSDNMDDLEEEFREFQVMPNSALPKHDGSKRIDHFWGEMASLKTAVTHTPRFPFLSKLACSLCCLPNSNADCERIFSTVRKIQTDNRSLLDNDTLDALLTCKVNRPEDCFAFKPNQDVLKMAKTACYTYNKELSSASVDRD